MEIQAGLDWFYENLLHSTFFNDIIQWSNNHSVLLWSIILFPFIYICFSSFATIVILYSLVLYCKAYRLYYKRNDKTSASDYWEHPRRVIACIFNFFGRFYFGHDIEGFNNIPTEGPALIVPFHGALPVDHYFVLAKINLLINRQLHTVADIHFLSLPGYEAFTECVNFFAGNVETCADVLRKGNLLVIFTGGAREGYFGDENYHLMWGKRVGFAKVATAAKVPIIPMFTKNIREAYFTLKFFRKWLRPLYERTRTCVIPFFGGLPVKLTTIIGEPIPYDPNRTVEETAEKIQQSLEELIRKHQRIPGSMYHALKERFHI